MMYPGEDVLLSQEMHFTYQYGRPFPSGYQETGRLSE